MDKFMYEVEIAYNGDSNYNPRFYFLIEEEMLNFVKLSLRNGYPVRIGGVEEDE